MYECGLLFTVYLVFIYCISGFKRMTLKPYMDLIPKVETLFKL